MNAPIAQMLDDAMRQKLCSLAFYALNLGRGQQADELFEMLKVVKPESPLPYIGLANGQLKRGTPTQAVTLLKEQALPRSSDGAITSLTLAYLGLALQMSGDAKASNECFDQVLEANNNPSAVTLVNKVRSLLSSEANAKPATRAAAGPVYAARA